MNESDIALLSEAMQRCLAKTLLAFHRSMFGKVEWGDGLLCIPRVTNNETANGYLRTTYRKGREIIV